MASKPIRIPKPAPVKPFVGWPSLKAAKLQWRDEVPESERYGDIYFSRDNGLEETRHVFLQGIKAPEIWQDKAHFAIGETGFGTGLNFLACWDLWRRTAPAGSRLTFASVEAGPSVLQIFAAPMLRFQTSPPSPKPCRRLTQH